MEIFLKLKLFAVGFCILINDEFKHENKTKKIINFLFNTLIINIFQTLLPILGVILTQINQRD